MTPELVELLTSNISFGVLFVVLFIWVLRTNDEREKRYLNILDRYGQQLENIAASLQRIQEEMEKINRATP